MQVNEWVECKDPLRAFRRRVFQVQRYTTLWPTNSASGHVCSLLGPPNSFWCIFCDRVVLQDFFRSFAVSAWKAIIFCRVFFFWMPFLEVTAQNSLKLCNLFRHEPGMKWPKNCLFSVHDDVATWKSVNTFRAKQDTDKHKKILELWFTSG